MAKRIINKAALLLIFFISSSLLLANEENLTEKDEKKLIPKPTSFVTEHEGRFGGKLIKYRISAGETYLRDKDDEPKATIFTFAYTKINLDDGEVRPVTFLWNGGPGSASPLLHMGIYGPKRISVPSNAEHSGAPPYPVLAAPETILDVTDLFFKAPLF